MSGVGQSTAALECLCSAANKKRNYFVQTAKEDVLNLEKLRD
jgi:hypothetical protein